MRKTADEWRALAHMTAAEAAEAMGTTPSAAHKISKRHGFAFVPTVPEPSRADDEFLLDVLALGDRGHSERAVARRLGVSHGKVQRTLRGYADA